MRVILVSAVDFQAPGREGMVPRKCPERKLAYPILPSHPLPNEVLALTPDWYSPEPKSNSA